MKQTVILSLLFCALFSTSIMAQKVAKVHGTYTYIVGEHETFTLNDVCRKSIELAKNEAIKSEFGEMITSDIIETSTDNDGKAASSFWSNTVAQAKGIWLKDTKAPEQHVQYTDGKLMISAEVWGEAREITQAKPEFKWDIVKDDAGKRVSTREFTNGERIFIKFRAPAKGYVAIYLLTNDDEASCLLPYRTDPNGRFAVNGSTDYMFFDKEEDASALHYSLSTKLASESDQIVVIYSPNPFTKCADITGDARHPNSTSTRDFQKWLLKCQRHDQEMAFDKQWVKIRKPIDD